jgi:hypothetical protein
MQERKINVDKDYSNKPEMPDFHEDAYKSFPGLDLGCVDRGTRD